MKLLDTENDALQMAIEMLESPYIGIMKEEI